MHAARLLKITSTWSKPRKVVGSAHCGGRKPTRSLATSALNNTLFPSVSRLLHEYSLQLANLTKLGTGPKGRLTKGDVLKYVKDQNLKPSPAPLPPVAFSSSSSAPAASSSASQVAKASSRPLRVQRNRTGPSTFDEEPVDNMRRVIAQRLTESKATVPHSYATREINLGALSSLRKQLNAQLEDASKLSVTDFLMRASALALKIVPEANAQFDAKTGQANLLPNIDISLAVALDAGLITPIVVSADKKGLSKISSETKDLVTRARSNRLKPHEYQGGTFSISNLGMYGISEFTAVINPPQAMILAVGGPISGATFDEASQAPKASTSLRVSLSYDARAISTDVAFKWLDTFEEILNNPQRMML